MSCGVYKITNIVSGKVYVGSSLRMEERWGTHKRELKKKTHYNDYFQKAWDKNGTSSFIFEVIEVCEPTNLIDQEQYYIEKFESYSSEKGYNLCRFPLEGTRGLRWNHSEEGKERISEALTGLKRGPYSEEHRSKISIANKGRKRSPESIAKQIREATGKKRPPYSEEHKMKIGMANKGKTKGIPKTLEHRKRISEAMKGRCKSEEAKRNMRKPHKKRILWKLKTSRLIPLY